MTAPPDSEDEYLKSADAAIRAGGDVLASLAFDEVLADLDGDLESRRATYAVFRAQGRASADTGALGALLSHPYKPHLPGGTARVTGTVGRRSTRRGLSTVVVGLPPGGHLLIDREGTGTYLVDVGDATFRPIAVPGLPGLHEVMVDLAGRTPLVTEEESAGPRRRSRFLGRVALAYDMLGAAEATLAAAVDYAGDRQQFGQPIGRFQAVRHLLASASVDCAAVEAVAHQAASLDSSAPSRYGELVKAVAGRNCRRVCERALQTFGGIGFITEHPHPDHHSRVLALDGLLGSSTALGASLAAGCTTPGAVDDVLGTSLLAVTP